MVPALYGSDIRNFRILIVRGSERHLDARIRLEESIESIAIGKVDERRRIEIVRGVAHGDGCPNTKDRVVVMEIGVLGEPNTRGQQGDEND